jgi:putative endonuclease
VIFSWSGYELHCKEAGASAQLFIALQFILREHGFMYYVYVLRDQSTEKLYIGYSADLKTRIQTHQQKRVKSTKSGNYELIYYEAYLSKYDALGREKFLKGGSGRKYINKQLVHYLKRT